ncbi:MAG: NAD(P)-dependent oxidoreductase [Microgenomates group bacterium]|jgi:dTDP-4-dehydrorhamnose reductase|nr:NAD(P)-dependent oxidoreductase [Candidatus Woesebacteria bacterium]MBP6882839.1 NAD(P)-dependent oxidoreductase [Candidatus Woesebacteria bacterium]QQR63582.1 MAG: NAD(P)-dependent oxidoreductase [Candidatus Roizmanbacteria bacterium]
MKVAITGSTGLVGSRIVELLQDNFTFIPLNHSDVDLTDKDSVDAALSDLDFDLLLHCAGYTNVDKAEIEKEQATLLNVEATRYLLEATQKKNKKIIYISTDFVFDGREGPYDENSQPNPIGYYGKTKFEGEEVVKDRGMIVRISYPYRAAYEKRGDFFRTIKSLVKQGKSITGITDSIITPTFIDDIAYGLKYLMKNFRPEIFHLVGGDSLSPHDAFTAIAEVFQLDSSLIAKTTYDEFFKGKAQRPRHGHTISVKNSFHPMKTFKDALIEIAASIK